jgi:hypothetical protein
VNCYFVCVGDLAHQLGPGHGKISGAKGAALKLGIPASALESKIKALKINKHRFKVQ